MARRRGYDHGFRLDSGKRRCPNNGANRMALRELRKEEVGHFSGAANAGLIVVHAVLEGLERN